MDIKGLPWHYGGMWERLRETQIEAERDRHTEGERDREKRAQTLVLSYAKYQLPQNHTT